MKRFISALLLLLNCNDAIYAGDSAHGGDTKGLADGAAWFVGQERIIRYCYQVDPSFGVSSEEIFSTIKTSFKTWREYLEKKLPSSDSVKITTESAPLDKCTGSEDLKFYFGVTDPNVTAALKRYRDPVGIAHLISYDGHRGWGKGLIWISSPRNITLDLAVSDSAKRVTHPLNWKEPNALSGILLHELGHVFGSGHIPNTIMDEAIVYRILKPKLAPDQCPEGDPFLTQIDNQHELIPCIRCEKEGRTEEWTGRLGDTEDRTRDNFNRLTGEEASGPIQASWRINRNNQIRKMETNTWKRAQVPELMRKLELKVADASRTYTFPITTVDDLMWGLFNWKAHNTPVFSIFLQGGFSSINYDHISASQLLKFEIPTHKKNLYRRNLYIEASYNPNEGIFSEEQIRVRFADSRAPLFLSGEGKKVDCLYKSHHSSPNSSIISIPLLGSSLQK